MELLKIMKWGHLMLVTLPISQQECVFKLHCCFSAGHARLWEEGAQRHLGFALFAPNPALDQTEQ